MITPEMQKRHITETVSETLDKMYDPKWLESKIREIWNKVKEET